MAVNIGADFSVFFGCGLRVTVKVKVKVLAIALLTLSQTCVQKRFTMEVTIRMGFPMGMGIQRLLANGSQWDSNPQPESYESDTLTTRPLDHLHPRQYRGYSTAHCCGPSIILLFCVVYPITVYRLISLTSYLWCKPKQLACRLSFCVREYSVYDRYSIEWADG